MTAGHPQEGASKARQGETDWIASLPLTYRFPRSHTQAFRRHTDYASSIEVHKPARMRVDRWVATLAVVLLGIMAAAILR
jgi:hypothetical protein